MGTGRASGLLLVLEGDGEAALLCVLGGLGRSSSLLPQLMRVGSWTGREPVSRKQGRGINAKHSIESEHVNRCACVCFFKELQGD